MDGTGQGGGGTVQTERAEVCSWNRVLLLEIRGVVGKKTSNRD